MTAAELMKPRFEVIEDYPNSVFLKGKILIRIKHATNDIYHSDEDAIVGGLYLSEIEKYPHLFRKLNWWEKRKVEDMPKKVKIIDADRVYEIVKWDMKHMIGFVDVKKREGCDLLLWYPEYGYIPVD